MDFLISNQGRDQYPDVRAQHVVATLQRVYDGEFLPRVQATPMTFHYVADHVLGDTEDGLTIDPRSSSQYLGEHHLDKRMRSTVMLGDCAVDGENPDEVMGHELFEGGMDPPAVLEAVIDAQGTVEAWEACDPLQGTSKTIDGVVIPNFVLPWGYFCEVGTQYDWLGVLTAPHTRTPGGYRLVRAPGQDWTQDEGEKMPSLRRLAELGRWSRRGQRIHRRSTALMLRAAGRSPAHLLGEAISSLRMNQAGRELALAITKAEEAEMWYERYRARTK